MGDPRDFIAAIAHFRKGQFEVGAAILPSATAVQAGDQLFDIGQFGHHHAAARSLRARRNLGGDK